MQRSSSSLVPSESCLHRDSFLRLLLLVAFAAVCDAVLQTSATGRQGSLQIMHGTLFHFFEVVFSVFFFLLEGEVR